LTGRINNLRRTILICVLLGVGTLAIFWPVLHHEFLNLDDQDYVTQNEHVLGGLTWENTQWAFQAGYASNWHPLTWLSHMLDVQLFGLKPGWHHGVNLLLHIANSLLLFLLFKRMTGARWRSAFVAALFALHPLHVESVAWVAERKDVLSTFFFMLTLLAYTKYVEEKAESRKQKAEVVEHGGHFQLSAFCFRLSAWYGLALGLFALGLMSKPMLVTLPFVLLLLDYWPLQRLRLCDSTSEVQSSKLKTQRSTFLSLLREKIPFLLLSASSCFITWLAQKRGGAIATLEAIPTGLRIENALVSYCAYLGKMIWPAPLAAYYPMPEAIPAGKVTLAAVALLLVTTLVLAARHKRPCLIVGWLWYLGTLIPVIGLVQVGLQSMADRYTYIPLIGPFFALTWGIADSAILNSQFSRKCAVAVFPLSLLAVCATFTLSQVRFWRDSETLHRHTLAVTTNNPLTHLNLGSALAEQGEFDEAAGQFSAAVHIKPSYAAAQSNWGFVLSLQGKFDQAIAHYRAALQINPRLARTHYLLGSALTRLGQRDQALAEYRSALEINPDAPPALNDLAWALATAADAPNRSGAEAVALAERACRLTGFQQPLFIGTLAAAYAEAGRFDDAVNTAEKARDLALAAGQKDLSERNAQLLELYRAQKPYHEEK
jgi:protein O-mannosyl-transferase